MMYVYAIADRPEQPLPDQLGLHDEGLAKVIWSDVVAVVSSFNGAHLSKNGDELWRHEEVVESLMSDRTVLPVRFGTLLPSRQRVADLLCRAYHELVQDIASVRGHVEFGMRFLSVMENDAEAAVEATDWVDSEAAHSDGGDRPLSSSPQIAPPRTGPGSAYLWARVARKRELRDRQRAELRLVRGVYDVLASCANASRLDSEPEDRLGISAAFLVPCDRSASFRVLVDRVTRANPDLALLCTGPWPPYSFVRAGARAISSSEECHAS
jgi:gas vesicle protein GvpL/GvpF